MYQLEYPWLLAALPLPLAVWWLLPPYCEETASVRLAFFGDVSRAAGLTPASGAVVLRTTWLQKIVAPAGSPPQRDPSAPVTRQHAHFAFERDLDRNLASRRGAR